LLSQPVDVSGDRVQWKALCDCSRDDLLCTIRYRREIATRNLQAAAMYELADRMTIWQTGADLSDDVVTAVLHWAGA
jgi:hypothetical protein